MNGQDEAKASPDTPPYFSGTTFYNFVEAHRRSLPTRIDRSIMGNIAGGDQARILKALWFFDLIGENGKPTSTFETLRDVEGEELQRVWADLLRAAYPFLFSDFNLEKATQGQIEERFREQGIRGDTIRKAVTFFITLARLAGLKLSPYFKATRARGARGPKPQRKGPRATAPPRLYGGGEAVPINPTPVLDPALFGKLHPAVQAWIDEMPFRDTQWERADFESWLAIFKASVERAYKIPQK
jgi:hypothetical protein